MSVTIQTNVIDPVKQTVCPEAASGAGWVCRKSPEQIWVHPPPGIRVHPPPSVGGIRGRRADAVVEQIWVHPPPRREHLSIFSLPTSRNLILFSLFYKLCFLCPEKSSSLGNTLQQHIHALDMALCLLFLYLAAICSCHGAAQVSLHYFSAMCFYSTVLHKNLRHSADYVGIRGISATNVLFAIKSTLGFSAAFPDVCFPAVLSNMNCECFKMNLLL